MVSLRPFARRGGTYPRVSSVAKRRPEGSAERDVEKAAHNPVDAAAEADSFNGHGDSSMPRRTTESKKEEGLAVFRDFAESLELTGLHILTSGG